MEMVRPAMAFPSVPRAANPTMSPDSPAAASSPAESTRSSGNCVSEKPSAANQMTKFPTRRVSASCVAVSGRSVPRARCRSRVRLMVRLRKRDAALAIASSTAAVTMWRSSRLFRNNGMGQGC